MYEGVFVEGEKVGMFIDGANVYAATKDLRFNIDFSKFKAAIPSTGFPVANVDKGEIQRGAQLIRAYYYTGLSDEPEMEGIRKMADWLDYNGYTMVTKRAKTFTTARGDGSSRKIIKGNMDVEICCDMLKLAPCLDHLVLVSGDGDFTRVIRDVQEKGKRVTVVSTATVLADELKRVADNYIDLDKIRTRIERTGFTHRNDDLQA